MATMRLDTLIAFPDGRVVRFGEMRAEEGQEQVELSRRYAAWAAESAELHARAVELISASGARTLAGVGTPEARDLIAAIAMHEAREPFRPQSLDDLIEQVRREHSGADADTLTRALFEDHADAVEPYARALGGPEGIVKLVAQDTEEAGA
jgi:hypothetical protein